MLKKVFKYSYFVLLFAFALFAVLAIFISLLESFSYSGFFLKHFHLPIESFSLAAFVCGFLILVTSANFLKKQWLKLAKILLLLNTYIFIGLSIAAFLIYFIESAHYPNYVYSKIHLQPGLLSKTAFLEFLFLYVNFSFIVWAGEGTEKFISFFRKKKFKIKIASVQNFILKAYSVFVLIFIFSNSLGFITKFYKSDKTFLKENELKYFFQQIDIYQWIKVFFPKTSNIIYWCDQQQKPVELITFDPQIIWLDYEGLSRIFLTNCRYVNIDSVNKSLEYFGKDNLLLVSITPCEPKLEGIKPDPKGNINEYFKIVNNLHICRSKQILPNLYMFKGDNSLNKDIERFRQQTR